MKKCTYKVWEFNDKIYAAIYLKDKKEYEDISEEYEDLFIMQDHLSEEISQKYKMCLYKDEYKPTELDRNFYFFHEQDKDLAVGFFNKQIPGVWHHIFNTTKAKEWENERDEVDKKSCFEIHATHDDEGIEVATTLFNEKELADFIEKVFLNSNFELINEA